MITTSNQRFFDHFNSPISDIYILIKINNLRNQKDKDYFCFVEGSTDEKFYSTTSLEIFNKKNVEYIYAEYHNEEMYKGKKAVVLATKTIVNRFSQLRERCIFIVDHDDFGIDEFKGKIDKVYLDMLTILPVYSFENYYFCYDNLRIVLKQFINEESIEIFLHEFDLFYTSIIEYFACKATKTAAHIFDKYSKYLKLANYRPEAKDDDIFVFNFENSDVFRKELLELEVQKLKFTIEEEKELNKLFVKIKKRLLGDVYFIKGKILFRFLTEYLRYHYKINLMEKSNYNKINKLLLIDLPIKNI